MAYLKVRVTPGSRKEEIAGWAQDTLRVRIKAPPERGKANDAVVAFLAKALNVAPTQVTLRRGATSREKLVFVDGLTDAELRRRLDAG